MSLPQFTAASALYRSKHEYREYGGGEDVGLLELGDGGVEVLLAGIICTVNAYGQRECTGYCPVCEDNETCCNGSCTDHGTDYSNCGECGFACPTGARCDNGACYCTTGEKICGNACSDTATDRSNCGVCGNVCPSGATCVNGACVCSSGSIKCGNTCSDTSTDPDNCGACGNSCNGGTCSGGKCICPSGYKNCGNTCLGTNSDSRNCGNCGNVCPEGTGCQAGKCVNTTVTPGVCNQAMYNANCLNLDPGNPEHSILAIECLYLWGKCQPGWECCNGEACRDTKFDSDNCGGCGRSCSDGDTCCNGQCVPYGTIPCGETCCLPGYTCFADSTCCPAGYSFCGGSCCPPNNSCCNGSCCPQGKTCDHDCCINPMTSPGGNNNYIIYNACQPIDGLIINFTVDQELVTNGEFSLQFNAYSIAGNNFNDTELIQYIFYIDGTQITPNIQYPGYPGTNGWTGNAFPITLTTGNTLPKNYQLELQLTTDNNQNSNAATFTVTDNEGNFSSQTILLNNGNTGATVTVKSQINGVSSTQGPTPTNAPAPSNSNLIERVPIGSFQVNLVAPGSGDECVIFNAGGAATITYSSNDQLCVEGGNNFDQCTGFSGFTAESSNAQYSALSSCCSGPGSSFNQTLSITNPSTKSGCF
jgi:hypothetical protein